MSSCLYNELQLVHKKKTSLEGRHSSQKNQGSLTHPLRKDRLKSANPPRQFKSLFLTDWRICCLVFVMYVFALLTGIPFFAIALVGNFVIFTVNYF